MYQYCKSNKIMVYKKLEAICEDVPENQEIQDYTKTMIEGGDGAVYNVVPFMWLGKGVCHIRSYSNREGIDEKLKYMQKLYKMKVLKKMTKYVFWVYKDLSYSYREGMGKKMKYKQKPYKMKGWKMSQI